MLKMNTVVADQATTANGSGVEQATSPYLPGTTVVSVIQPVGFTGTSILQGSDDKFVLVNTPYFRISNHK